MEDLLNWLWGRGGDNRKTYLIHFHFESRMIVAIFLLKKFITCKLMRAVIKFFFLNPVPIGLFCVIWIGGGSIPQNTPLPLYDFALRVEKGECDICPYSNFSRPAH